jgi:hypothetical protein
MIRNNSGKLVHAEQQLVVVKDDAEYNGRFMNLL